MPKDPVLSEKFYSLEQPASEIALTQQASRTLTQLIKEKLYPHLSNEQLPTYYQGTHTFSELDEFIYLNNFPTYTGQFTALQTELNITVDKLRSWADANDIAGAESLSVFWKKLTYPAEEVVVLYADGKKLLEKIAVLLDEPGISLEYRKKALSNLLDDRALEKCVNGCYSPIASAALQLQENLTSNNQIKHWLRSFAKDMARNVAAQRPFAIPETYQAALCRASDCTAGQNMLHASNYLLMQAKEHGFPMDSERDPGAIELGNGLSQLSKEAIVNAYKVELEKQITAKHLVDYLSAKLHESFQLIMSAEIDYASKTTLILDKLNILGEDFWFKTNKVGLEEIIDEHGQLKAMAALKITVTERLIQCGLLEANPIEYIVSAEGRFRYRGFPSAVELTWLWVDDERKPFLQLIKNDHLPTLVPLIYTFFIQDIPGLLAVMESLPRKYDNSFFNRENLKLAVSLMKQSSSPQLFKELLSRIPDSNDKKLFLREYGDAFVRRILSDALRTVDFRSVLPGVSFSYTLGDYNARALQEGLSITRDLIRLVIDNGFENFNGIHFYKLDHLNYLDTINFSKLNLEGVHFYQIIDYCWFDEAKLTGAKFYQTLKYVSFRRTDLREVFFQPHLDLESLFTDLNQAILSTESFKNLSSSGNLDFTGADLRVVDFQDPRIKNGLRLLDFSKANLQSINFSGMDLGTLILRGADLENANLFNANVLKTSMDTFTNLKLSCLDWETINYTYTQGVRNFDGCKVFNPLAQDGPIPLKLYRISRSSFKRTKFIGEAMSLDFTESDLSGALFKPPEISEFAESILLLALKAKKSRLHHVIFHQVSFLDETEVSSSSLKELSFEKVKMHARVLFKFYAAGQRDFKGVDDLKGTIPTKLMPFPVLEAELNKDTFIHLYQQGLRDFRGSNLNSFYLNEVLAEHSISEIDLKLGGAQYKRSSLGCLPTQQQQSTLDILSRCVVYILFQKEGTVQGRKLSLEDIEELANSSGQTRFILQEAIVSEKPLFLLENINEINFYWGYLPDEETVHRSLEFIRASTLVSERQSIQLRFYLFQRFSENGSVEFVMNLINLGFSDIEFNYYNEQTQFSSPHVKGNTVSVAAGRQQLEGKFRSILDESKFDLAKIQNRESHRDRLSRIGLEIRRKTGGALRTMRHKGAHFELGAGLINLVSRSINHPDDPPEVQLLDPQTKAYLKNFAHNITLEVGRSRRASHHQIATVLNLTQQCIDRGSCANEELVMKESMYFLYSMRPDIVVGNEQIWQELKGFFISIGQYLSDMFDEVKQFFSQKNITSRTKDSLDLTNASLRNLTLKRHKRKMLAWYESPLLMRFIKEIEAGLKLLGYDSQHDDRYSEEIVAGILYELWQTLDQHHISNYSKSETILSLLNNDTFIETIVNGTIVDPSFETGDSVQEAIDLTPRSRRNPRSVRLPPQETDQARIWDQTDTYLFQYEHSKLKSSKKKNKHSIHIDNDQHNRGLHQSSNNPSNSKYPPPIFTKKQPKKTLATRSEEKRNTKIDLPDFSIKKNSKIHLLKVKTFNPVAQVEQSTVRHRQISYKNNSSNQIKANKAIDALQFKEGHSRVPAERLKWEILSNNNNSRLNGKYTTHHQQTQKLSRVTAQSDISSTLFALNVWVRQITQEKYRPPLNVQAAQLQQRAQKQIEKSSKNRVMIKL